MTYLFNLSRGNERTQKYTTKLKTPSETLKMGLDVETAFSVTRLKILTITDWGNKEETR